MQDGYTSLKLNLKFVFFNMHSKHLVHIVLAEFGKKNSQKRTKTLGLNFIGRIKKAILHKGSNLLDIKDNGEN